MHHANHFYGHAHVLARFGGLDPATPPRIHGYLQHGWNIGDGLAPGTPFVGGSPVFVWSERTRRRAHSLGRHNVTVVGAPFAYLVAMQPDAGTPREGAIYYPFHGWEGQRVSGDHHALIEQIKATEEGPITVCLYWQEYQTKRIRAVYEKAGLRVISHGHRGFWWDGTDPDFLVKQLAELRAHRRVASNRLSSAVLYGTLAGCQPAVYGDPMLLRGEEPTFGGYTRMRRQWPQLHGARLELAAARAAAVAELGADRLLSPVELREVFGWTAS
jgi:hypothetical protein